MTAGLVLWAQALDNASPDHIEMGGEPVPPGDAASRQEAVSLVSGVTREGRRVVDEEGVRLTLRGRRFVLQVPSAERDAAGRTAPMVCCGIFGTVAGGEFEEAVVAEVNAFAARIGRSIEPSHLDLARRAIAERSWLASFVRFMRGLPILLKARLRDWAVSLRRSIPRRG